MLPANLLQCSLSTGGSFLHGITTCSGMGFLAAVWISALTWFMCCMRSTCVIMVFSTGCRGTPALVPAAPSPTPPSQVLVTAVFFFLVFSLLSQSCCCGFCPFLNIRGEWPTLMSAALASGESILELAGTVSIWQGVSSWCLLTEGTPSATPQYQKLAK